MFVKKLKSVFSPQIASLSLSATIFVLLLGLLSSSRLWLWVVAYVGYALYVYVRYIQRAKTGAGGTFLFFFGAAFLIARTLQIEYVGIPIFLFLGALLFFFLGSFTLHVANPKLASSTFYYFFIFVFFATVLRSAAFPISWWRLALLFIFLWVVIGDYIRFLSDGFDARKRIFVLIIALLGTQVGWVASFLSLGFLHAASLTLVFVITAMDLVVHFFSGTLNVHTLKKDLIFFGGFSLLILFLPLVF